MKKQILKFLICCIASVGIFTISASAFSNEPQTAGDEVINVIKLLEIANGDQNGNMNFDKEVTRAEFVKMAINASTAKETAANIKLNVSLFPDVRNNYWGAGYISVAINNGLVTGYIDGTFRPNNEVTLEEAATIVLRLLGYTSSDIVGSYPSAQLQKYNDLDLDKDISARRGDKLTREECMILLYNALSAKTKQGTIYCTTLGITANGEGKLDYSALLEEKLSGPVSVSDTSDIFSDTSFVENENTSYHINNSETTKNSIMVGDVIYYSDVINAVYAYRKSATGILEASTGNSVTLSGKPYAIATATAKDKLSFGGKFSEEKSFITLILGINDGVVDVIEGSIDRLGDNDDNSSILSIIDKTISKPIFIDNSDSADNWKSKIPFDTENSNIYFNGAKTASQSVAANDVIYYSKALNSVWIYRKTISGTIEQITPVTAPTSVTVSGKTYSVVSSEAAYDLSVYGAYEVGDRVTLILGLNDVCISVADTKTTAGLIYGVVTATGEKKYTDKNGEEYTADFVTVTDTAANTYTYEYNNRYYSVGDAVKVSVSDTVSISKLSYDFGRSTALALSNAIRNGKFADACEIIDVNGSDVIKVKPERISGTVIDTEQFLFSTVSLYHEYDDEGRIKKLILKNFTGDIDEYGVVTDSSVGKINYMTDKNERTISTEGQSCSAGPAKLRIENGNIVGATSLTGFIENISSITNIAVYDKNDNEYLVADNVKVFVKTATGYEYSKISDVAAGNYTFTAYFDKLPMYGGRIRVITALRKV